MARSTGDLLKRSLLTSLVAIATVGATLSLGAPAQAAGDSSIRLGLDQARDLLRRGALDDPAAAPSFVSGDDELVEVHAGAVTARLGGLTGAADLADYGSAIVVDLPSLGKLAVVDIASGLVERGRVDVGAGTCPRHLTAAGSGLWFFVGCTAPYRIARADIPEDPNAPLPAATIFNAAGDPSWASLPTIVPVESGVWIGSAEGVRAYTLSSIPIPGVVGAAVDASTLVSSSSGGQLLAGSGSQYWKLSGDTGALQGGPFPAPANWDAVHYFAGFAPGILMGSAGSSDPLELRDTDNSLIRKIPAPVGAGALIKGTLAYDGSKATALWDTSDSTDTILGSMDARPRITVVLAVDFTSLGDLVTAHVHGHLTDPAGKPKRVGIDLVHTDRRGDHPEDISADANGHFEADLPLNVGGPNTFTVVTQFDSSWAESSDSVSVDLPARAWDLTGNGTARIVVGAPGEDVGTLANAGAFARHRSQLGGRTEKRQARSNGPRTRQGSLGSRQPATVSGARSSVATSTATDTRTSPSVHRRRTSALSRTPARSRSCTDRPQGSQRRTHGLSTPPSPASLLAPPGASDGPWRPVTSTATATPTSSLEHPGRRSPSWSRGRPPVSRRAARGSSRSGRQVCRAPSARAIGSERHSQQLTSPATDAPTSP